MTDDLPALIPVAGPWITDLEIEYVRDAVANAWYQEANRYHERFEREFAKRVDRRFAMALPSCTSGLHLALAALDIGPGDEVIVPDLTWIASVAPVKYVGATPVFADVDPNTWCLSAAGVEECLSPRTKAIIAVDLYGNMPDMAALQGLADRHGLAFIEDAAEAHGSRWRGRPAGSFGRLGVFSFHGSKTLTTGEGGMLVTDDEALFRRCQVLRDHGREPGDTMFFNREVAFKYKMSAMQAALGLAQTERLDELVARKREIFRWYEEELAGVQGLTLNTPGDDVFSSYWMVTVLWPEAKRLDKRRVVERLRGRRVDSRPVFFPLSALPAFADTPEALSAHERNRCSYAVSGRGINLPSALSLDHAQVTAVCTALQAVLAEDSQLLVPPPSWL